MTVRIGSHLQQAAIGVAARMSRAERLALAADLRRVVVDGEVLSDPADLETFAYDASFLTQLAPVVPDVAVVARTAADVVAVMRHARAHGIPVTPRGAASGAGGGCVALRGGIVLAMNAMDSILEVDVANGQVVVEPGVVHARLNEVLAADGLIFPPDPGSSRMATIGGMASTNAHGVRAVKYGPRRRGSSASPWSCRTERQSRLGRREVAPSSRPLATS